MRRHVTFVIAVFFALAGPARAGTFDDELKGLQEEFKAAETKFREALGAAKTNEERSKVYAGMQPEKVLLPKYQALAQKAAKDKAGLEANLWIVQSVGRLGNEGAKAGDVAIASLLDHHLKSPELEKLASALRWAWGVKDGGEPALRIMMNKSPHDAVKASAMFTLGAKLCDNSNSDAKKIQEAKELLTELQKKYSDTPYAAQAKPFIFELEHLQVGMTAPDFEAMDPDGKKFRLSEYRGKVVVLDFWGFW